MLLWRVYYDDSNSIDSNTNQFHIPTDGVIAIVQPDPDVSRIVLHRWDYYCWREDEKCWYGSELGGFWDYMFNYKGAKQVLFGRTIPTKLYNHIVQIACNDKDFPVSSSKSHLSCPERR
ncbi:MAG: hypothetical protein V3U84_02330 [Thiotrichaceae bacterium]